MVGPVDISRVKKGEAPDTADRIYIMEDRGGFYSWTGVVDVGGEAVFGGSPPEFRTVHDAETDAVTWAMGHGITQLTIEGGEG